MNELKTTIDKVMDMAKAKGAEADCILDKSDLLSLKAEEGELSEYKVSGSQVLGIRVIKMEKLERVTLGRSMMIIYLLC